MLEIHSHGNQLMFLSCLGGKIGGSEAEPGEFSKRAFLNNKISLIQAEGISLGIDETKDQLVALNSFRSGSLSKKVEGVVSKLNAVLVGLEAQLDFSDEEDVAEANKSSMKTLLMLRSIGETY